MSPLPVEINQAQKWDWSDSLSYSVLPHLTLARLLRLSPLLPPGRRALFFKQVRVFCLKFVLNCTHCWLQNVKVLGTKVSSLDFCGVVKVQCLESHQLDILLYLFNLLTYLLFLFPGALCCLTLSLLFLFCLKSSPFFFLIFLIRCSLFWGCPSL